MSKIKHKTIKESSEKLAGLSEIDRLKRQLEIEAALERVRNRTLLMRDSSELNDAVAVFFQQFQSLDLLPAEARTYFCHINADTDIAEVWMTHADGTVMTGSHQTPLSQSASMSQYYKAWKQGKPIMVRNYTGAALTDYLKFVSSLPHVKADKGYQKLFRSPPKQVIMTDANFLQGNIGIMTFEPLSPEAIDTLKRFAKVFEFTYTRFLDLKTAEAQAREAQIEAALERVRARTMAMRKGDELADTSLILFEQITELGIKPRSCGFLIMDEKTESMEDWSANLNEKGKASLVTGTLAFDQHPMISDVVETWRSGEPYFIGEIHGKDLQKYYQAVTSKESTSKAIQDKVLSKTNSEYTNSFYFEHGMMYVLTTDVISENEIDVLLRFANVFKLTYTRFLDLKKAEEQAREAQIEAALERVRSAAMAMHSSDDLFSVAGVLHDQLGELGQKELESSIIHIYPENLPTFDAWYSYRSTDNESRQVMDRALIPWNTCSWTRKVKAHYQSKEKSYMIESRRKMLSDWYKALETIAPAVLNYDDKGKILLPKVLYYHFSKFSGGALLMVSNEPPTEEARDMQQRAAMVFDLAYTRFLDLKYAEAQAREAQIEAALERVRSRSMAMQHSNELNIILAKVFEELISLKLELERCVIWIFNPEDKSVRWWAANPEAESGAESFLITHQDHPVYHEYWQAWEERRTKYLYVLEGENMVSWCDVLFNETELGRLPEEVQVGMREPDQVYLYNTFNDFGVLFLACLDRLSDEKFSILERFGKVFDQSYTRFKDIKLAEAREKEAIKQSSLDRVRAEIASMRNTKDLERITPIIWTELTTLGVPFFRCGVFIIDETSQTLHMYLSKPTGESLAALHLDFDDEDILLVKAAVDHWKTQTVHRTHWDRQQFREFTKSLKRKGLIESLKTYQQGEKPPESLI